MIDTHAHLAARDAFPEDALAHVLERAWDAGLTDIIVPAGSPEEIEIIRDLSSRTPHVFGMLGYHPEHAGLVSSQDVKVLRRLLGEERDERIVGIGEAGIDFYWKDDASTRFEQEGLCAAQIELAGELDLPISLHLRDKEGRSDAMDVLLRLLSKNPVRAVLHSCTLSPSQLAPFLERGCAISFSGILTFKSAASIRETAALVPIDRLLVETDSPFLAPPPHRGKSCEPSYVVETARVLADVRAMPFDTLWKQLGVNARSTYMIPA